MNNVVDLVDALAWPAVALVLLWMLRRPIRQFASQVTHVRVAGQEFIARTLDSTEQQLLRLLRHTSTTTTASQIPGAVPKAFEKDTLELAASDPHLALLKVHREIDRAVDLLEVSYGLWQEVDDPTNENPWRLFQVLARVVGVDADGLATLILFSILQEAALSDSGELPNALSRRMVAQALTVLGILNSLPRHEYAVVASNLQIYADRDLHEPVEGRLAVLISDTNEAGDVSERAICTSQPSLYKPGMRVTHEWEEQPPQNQLENGYIQRPDSEEILQIVGRMDFRGRNLDRFAGDDQ